MVSAYQGFCPFRRYNRIVHWVGYLSGIAVYLAGYLLVGAAIPTGGRVQWATSIALASCLLGLYMGWLYGKAVGSPYGNVLLSLLTPVFTPGRVYTIPFPELSSPDGTWHHPELVLGAVVGLFAALWAIRRSYEAMTDAPAWEREVLPYDFRVVDEQPSGRSSTEGSKAPERIHFRPRSDGRFEPRLDVRGWLVGLLVVVPIVSLGAYGVDTYGDQAFAGIMLFALLVLLHWGLTVEAPNEGEAGD